MRFANGRDEDVPTTHLPPGSQDMTRHEAQQLMNVQTAIAGIAVTEGIPICPFNIVVHIPSQKIWIRYIP